MVKDCRRMAVDKVEQDYGVETKSSHSKHQQSITSEFPSNVPESTLPKIYINEQRPTSTK
jgi:hypothetical protein